jgi:hypothetical protein
VMGIAFCLLFVRACYWHPLEREMDNDFCV